MTEEIGRWAYGYCGVGGGGGRMCFDVNRL